MPARSSPFPSVDSVGSARRPRYSGLVLLDHCMAAWRVAANGQCPSGTEDRRKQSRGPTSGDDYVSPRRRRRLGLGRRTDCDETRPLGGQLVSWSVGRVPMDARSTFSVELAVVSCVRQEFPHYLVLHSFIHPSLTHSLNPLCSFVPSLYAD